MTFILIITFIIIALINEHYNSVKSTYYTEDASFEKKFTNYFKTLVIFLLGVELMVVQLLELHFNS